MGFSAGPSNFMPWNQGRWCWRPELGINIITVGAGFRCLYGGRVAAGTCTVARIAASGRR